MTEATLGLPAELVRDNPDNELPDPAYFFAIMMTNVPTYIALSAHESKYWDIESTDSLIEGGVKIVGRSSIARVIMKLMIVVAFCCGTILRFVEIKAE